MAEHTPAAKSVTTKHDAVPESVHEVLQQPGHELPHDARTAFGPRFETDFSTVRVHSGPQADQSARQLGALAYTWGDHVVLSGQAQHGLAPQRRSAVLAHELSHVAQQQGQAHGQPDRVLPAADSAETHAHAATGQVLAGGRAPAAPRVAAGVAMVTAEEAEHKLWGVLPEAAKNLLRPYVPTAQAAVNAIVPPSTELPKPVEAIVDTAATVLQDVKPTLDSALPGVLPLAVPGPAAPGAAKAAPKLKPKPKASAAPAKPVSSAVGEQLRDYAMLQAGTVKGVGLEIGNIVDSVLWIPQGLHDLTEYALEHAQSVGVDAQTQQRALDLFHTETAEYDQIIGLAKHYGLYDETTKTVGVSKQIGGAFDAAASHIGGPLTRPDSLMFTSYEVGELTGAVGSQVALAFTGGEEVQLALKALNALGAAKSLVDEARSDPGWMKSAKFWTKAIGLGLSVLGIARSKAAGTITRIILSSEALVNAIPLVLQLIEDATNPKLNANERDAKTKRDVEVLIKFIVGAIASIIQRAKADAGKSPSGRAPDEGSTPRTATTPATTTPNKETEAPPPTNAAPTTTETPPVTQAPQTVQAPPTTQPPVETSPEPAAPRQAEPESPTTASPAPEPEPAPASARRPRTPQAPEPVRPPHNTELYQRGPDVTKPGFNKPELPPITGPLPPVKKLPPGTALAPEPTGSMKFPAPAKGSLGPKELNEENTMQHAYPNQLQALPKTEAIDAVINGRLTKSRDNHPKTGEPATVLETDGGTWAQFKEAESPFVPLRSKAVVRPGQTETQANLELTIRENVGLAVEKYVKSVDGDGIIRTDHRRMPDGRLYRAVHRFPDAFLIRLEIHDFENLPPQWREQAQAYANEYLAGTAGSFNGLPVSVELHPVSPAAPAVP